MNDGFHVAKSIVVGLQLPGKWPGSKVEANCCLVKPNHGVRRKNREKQSKGLIVDRSYVRFLSAHARPVSV